MVVLLTLLALLGIVTLILINRSDGTTTEEPDERDPHNSGPAHGNTDATENG